ncbi:Uridine kinase [uncultured Ruminococcus sp.]|uniref:adenylyl-sulfate kinase n=1 Tax=Massiliimalia timonensis TaxID=1987501 RepID=UPI000820D99D|nr:adenylyl-sulfate kinase [Massiliimalia timonensis]SCG97421.1 Uridine kinase [uncultured Clostridium sp.]SCH93490.1 Uridine kinase [uncultured Ruminococcus sp.]
MKYCSKMDRILVEPLAETVRRSPKMLVDAAECSYQSKILDLAKTILQSDDRIILLTGPSSSGKTTTAKLLQQKLISFGKSVYRISLDNFYKQEEELPLWNDGYVNYESIDALDLEHFNALMERLMREGAAQFPIFDFVKGRRSEETFPVVMKEDTYIIFEGIHALNPLLSRQFAPEKIMRVYVSVHSDFVSESGEVILDARSLRLLRRILRDQVHRDTGPVETLSMWEYVVRGEEEYIKPFRCYADYHLNSAHSYEPFVYAKTAVDSLASFVEHPKYGGLIRRLLLAEQRFEPLSPSWIPRDSLLTEFIS